MCSAGLSCSRGVVVSNKTIFLAGISASGPMNSGSGGGFRGSWCGWFCLGGRGAGGGVGVSSIGGGYGTVWSGGYLTFCFLGANIAIISL